MFDSNHKRITKQSIMPGSRKDLSSRGKDKTEDESWTCKLCNAKFQEEKAELLECEYCDGHFCRLCLKLSAAEYRLLGKRKDFHWYCPSCEEKALRNIKMEKEIEERCRDYFDRYEKCLSALEEAITEKPDKETVRKMIEDSKSNSASAMPDVNISEMNEKLDEYKESVRR